MTPPDGPNPFDEEALEELSEDMGEAMSEFVAGFLHSLDEARGRMRAALAEARLDEVGEIAHSLKGTAGYLGATAMSEVLAALQQGARDGDPAGVQAARLERVDIEAAAVHQRLAEYLA